MTTTKLAGLVAMLVTAGAASAQLAADANGDGAVSLDEMQQAAADAAARRFTRLDKDGDGLVTTDEMRQARRPRRAGPGAGLLGPDGSVSLEELRARRPNIDLERLKALDENQDGSLTRDELVAGRGRAPRERFARLDTNGDGALSLDELQAVRPELTVDAFNRLDQNGDGLITPDERSAHRGRPRRFGPPGQQ
jgi:Ca2+-binding EF-hand superfamily protein